jgi:hypothetical protein
MRPGNATRRPGRGVSAVSCSGNDSTVENSAAAQIFNIDGDPLPPRRLRRLCGAPRLAQPSWYRLAADRWREVAP